MSERCTQHEPAAEARVSHDLACIECWYNLRGLPAQGACPECGTPIERALYGDRLRHANQNWLQSLHRGLQWAGTCLYLLIIGYIGLLVIVYVTDAVALLIDWLFGMEFSKRVGVVFGFIVVFFIAPFAGTAYGLWLTATPEPRKEATQPIAPLLRRILSVAVMPALAAWVYVGEQRGLPTGLFWFYELITHLCLFTVFAHVALFISWSRRIKQRAGERIAIRSDERRVEGPVLLLAMCALLVLTVHWLPSVWGSWPPSRPIEPLDGKLFTIIWLLIMWDIQSLSRLVKHERAAAQTDPSAEPA